MNKKEIKESKKENLSYEEYVVVGGKLFILLGYLYI